MNPFDILDIRDGMNPARILSVFCSECGEFIGRAFEERFDEVEAGEEVCETCEEGEGL